jgi:hypothetical protein
MESCFTTAETYIGCNATQTDIASSGLPVGGTTPALVISNQSTTAYTIVGTSKSTNTFTYAKTAAGAAKSCTPTSGGGGCNAGTW